MTALAPASLSISAERSPVNGPLGSALQSCAPISTGAPFAAAAKRTSNVAGGHIIRSTAASLPATSGRRGTRTIFVSRAFPNPARRLAERPQARQRAAGDGLPASPYVATQSPPPYDAMAPGTPRVSLNHG